MPSQITSHRISDNRLVEVDIIGDTRGDLSVIEGNSQIPFEIKRVYYLFNVPAGSERAGHAHKTLFQLLLAVAGSFDVHLDDGFEKRTFRLNRPNIGLLMTPMVWRVIDNFSAGSVCLALASAVFDEADYIRSYEEFLSLTRSR